MKLRVQMFAFARQCAGADSVEIDVPQGATIADLRQALFARLPELGSLGPRLLFAVNGEYAAETSTLPPECEVACIPPVSGG
jgi:molybdopterin converting factor subunit 1